MCWPNRFYLKLFSNPSYNYLVCRCKGAKVKNEEEFRTGSWQFSFSTGTVRCSRLNFFCFTQGVFLSWWGTDLMWKFLFCVLAYTARATLYSICPLLIWSKLLFIPPLDLRPLHCVLSLSEDTASSGVWVTFKGIWVTPGTTLPGQFDIRMKHWKEPFGSKNSCRFPCHIPPQ